MSLFGDVMGFIDSGRAASSVSNADIAAEHGVQGAVQGANSGIQDQINSNNTNVNAAGDRAIGAVNGATGTANNTLQGFLDQIKGNLSPYLQAGAQGTQQLSDYAASNPQFNFDPSKYVNSDAFKFQLNQGLDAVTNRASATGVGASGSTDKAMEDYRQGLASTYYDKAFSQAQSQFQTNQNTTLANLSKLIDTGVAGTSMYDQSTQAFGGQQAQNTMNAGLFAGNTNNTLAQFLAQLGQQGVEQEGSNSITGSKLMGDYAVGAGQAHATGIMNQGAALTSGVSDLGSLITQLMAGGGGGH